MVDDVACLRPLHLMLAEPAVGDEFVHGQIIFPTHDGLVLEPDNHLAVVEACRFHACAKTREHRVSVEDIDRVVFRKIRNDRTEVSSRELLVLFFALKMVVGDCLRLVGTDLHESLLVLDIRDAIRRVGNDRSDLAVPDDLADKRAVKRVAARDDMVADLEDVSFSCFHGVSWL